MPRKPTYDPEPVNRLRYNPAAVEEVTERIHEQAMRPLNETLDAMAGDLAAEHGITEEVAALWLTHQMKQLLDEQRTFRAAQANSGGIPWCPWQRCSVGAAGRQQLPDECPTSMTWSLRSPRLNTWPAGPVNLSRSLWTLGTARPSIRSPDPSLGLKRQQQSPTRQHSPERNSDSITASHRRASGFSQAWMFGLCQGL